MSDGPQAARREGVRYVSLTGIGLINSSRLNKGTAFSDRERDLFGLHGLLPPHVGNIDEQIERRWQALARQSTPFHKYSFLRDLQDTNETLFYALLLRHIEETLPIVYTPTVGEGCQRFSEIWRKPRGLFLSYPNRDRMAQILSHHRYDDVKCIVVSDGERILGLGDQGAGGMGIPIGKMALYTALGGIQPEHCLPILLDVGTDNDERLKSPIYVGWRHARVRGPEYDAFVDEFVSHVKARWPRVLLQWEDFAGANAARLLERYKDELCTFNDDIQGSAAVAAATLMSAINVTGIPLEAQRIVVFGFGSAGVGIANLLVQAMGDAGVTNEEARRRFYAVDQDGLITERTRAVRSEQRPYARGDEEVRGWRSPSGVISLLDVVAHAQPTVLIGVSGQGGAFTEPIVRQMARHAARPVIFPLSNPTSRSEAAPQDLVDWTAGSAIVSTGSPFDPVMRNGQLVRFAQTNNSYIFPGLALGVVASQAGRVTDAMIMAAARALAHLAPTRRDPSASLLPPLYDARQLSRAIAFVVGRQAIQDGHALISDDAQLRDEIEANVWDPVYVPYERAP